MSQKPNIITDLLHWSLIPADKDHAVNLWHGVDPVDPDNVLAIIICNDSDLERVDLSTAYNGQSATHETLANAMEAAGDDYRNYLLKSALPRLVAMGAITCPPPGFSEEDWDAVCRLAEQLAGGMGAYTADDDGWTDAEEEDPDEETTVLACNMMEEDSGEPFIAFLQEGQWWHQHDMAEATVTHWRDLPALPKGKPIAEQPDETTDWESAR